MPVTAISAWILWVGVLWFVTFPYTYQKLRIEKEVAGWIVFLLIAFYPLFTIVYTVVD